MKHDIIDRDTGNIVGCISFSSDNSLPMLLADLKLAHRLINELQDRVEVLEVELASLNNPITNPPQP